MNRGSADLPGGHAPKRRASMRPRFMNRGSDVLRNSMESIVSCFNEAPIHESGKWQVNVGIAIQTS